MNIGKVITVITVLLVRHKTLQLLFVYVVRNYSCLWLKFSQQTNKCSVHEGDVRRKDITTSARMLEQFYSTINQNHMIWYGNSKARGSKSMDKVTNKN